MRNHAIERRGIRIARGHRNLDRRRRLSRLGPRNREDASFVRPRHPPRPLGRIETRALRRPHRLIPQMRIPYPRPPHRLEQLNRDPIRLELVMRQPSFDLTFQHG